MTSVDYADFLRRIIAYAQMHAERGRERDLVVSAHLCALAYMALSVGACDLGIIGKTNAEDMEDELDKVVDEITQELMKGDPANEA